MRGSRLTPQQNTSNLALEKSDQRQSPNPNQSPNYGSGVDNDSLATTFASKVYNVNNSTVNLIPTLDPYHTKIEEKLLECQDGFCSTIQLALGLSNEDMKSFVDLYEKEKGNGRVLKAKFAQFNSGLESLLVQQGKLTFVFIFMN